MLRVRLIASGSVQGVGFREFCRRIGESCSLSGYAKNLPDATVEIIAEGEGKKIDEFVRRISVKMPLGIHVEKLAEKERKEIKQKNFASFGVGC